MQMILVALALVLGGAWPVDDPSVIRGFDPPAVAWAAGHRGIDLAADPGDRVLAIASGTVSFVGTVAGKPLVTVSHQRAPGLRSTYEPVTALVRLGQPVAAGTVLGYVGADGGHCGGASHCLHVGLRTATAYLDPRGLIGRRPPVLKPLGYRDARGCACAYEARSRSTDTCV